MDWVDTAFRIHFKLAGFLLYCIEFIFKRWLSMGRDILVVDDEPGIRLLLTDVFNSEGYDVVTAKTGVEALKKINEKPFDLIILDCQLPILNGLEVAQQLENNQQTIPIIMMSGLPELLTNDLLTYDAIKKVVPKPFNIKDMIYFVKSAIV